MAATSIDLNEYHRILQSSRLLSDADLRKAWERASSGGLPTAEAFAAWLVKEGMLTRYQADSTLRGNKTFFLDDYKLVDRIGQGRMAGVYRAQHKLGMAVAVKILPPSKTRDEKSRARFEREASLALKLDHPRVVKTYHAGTAAGMNYIAMELLDGETLEDRLERKKPLTVVETLRLAQQILEGLRHLDEKKMVHRDLKPGNVMLQVLPGQSADKGQYAVKLLDIGLGRELFDDGESPAGADLTASGDSIGTPDYMAPEQSRDSHAADIRSDLYSLGCLLYECVAGSVPFPGKNVVVKLTKHATEMPAVPNYGPTPLGAEFHAFLWKLLAKNPNDRYATPATALAVVERLLQSATAAPLMAAPAVAAPVIAGPAMAAPVPGMVAAAGVGPVARPVVAAAPIVAPAAPPRAFAPPMMAAPIAPPPIAPPTKAAAPRESSGELPKWVWIAVAAIGALALVGLGVVITLATRR